MSKEINVDYITSKRWKFYHKNGAVASEFFKLMPDGNISGYSHPNETHWSFNEGVLTLINSDGVPTSYMAQTEPVDGLLTFSGAHIPDDRIVLCLTEQPAGWIQNTGTKHHLAAKIRDRGWKIGDHTYGLPDLIDEEWANLTIGKYTSIGMGVKIAFADHRSDTASTYPFSTLSRYWPSVPPGESDHISKGDVVIGNDVWIGDGVFIGSGVNIGDGCVIGARSVVTRNLKPYSVAAGVPARVIRRRFSDEVIADLLRLKWWDLPDEAVDSHLPLIMSTDIHSFIQALERIL